MFDRLPTPWGLVRGGVAPDHPNIKAVSGVCEKTAARPGFRFFGNVEVGLHISHGDLAERFHAIVYAYGAESDRRLGIPGEDLSGSVAATEFVAWYNGHPDYCERTFDLSCTRAVVVGNGNVAMDVARMLALTPEELRRTDIADHALEVLERSQIQEIVIVGRRGPAQAAFTNPELLELGELSNADVFVDPAEVVLDEHSAASIDVDGEATARRNVEILTGYSQRQDAGRPRRIVLRFLVSPLAITGTDRVEAIELVRNELVFESPAGRIAAQATDQRDTLQTGIVFRSVGYRGIALPGVPFDEQRGIIPNLEGRVRDQTGDAVRGGQYVVVWIKRGPSGVIGTNKKDAHETVDRLFEDLDAGRLLDPVQPAGDAIETLLAERCQDHVTYSGWEAIDWAERAAGELQERPRVKLTRRTELLSSARAQPVR
jgi:ferredoxin--NADP+ reductase